MTVEGAIAGGGRFGAPESGGIPEPATNYEQRLLAQYHVARALAESSSLREAAPVILRSICEALAWEVGGLWLVDSQVDELRLIDLWCSPTVQAEPFAAASRQLVFARGGGLPGRVLASGKPAWIVDCVKDPNFARAALAAEAGLHAAFAFPIRSRDGVIGVFDFFSCKSLPPEDILLLVMDGIGSQVGQFDERKRAEMALARKVKDFERTHEQFQAHHEELRRANKQLSNAQQVAGLGTYIFDIQLGRWNSSAILDQTFGIDSAYPRTVEGWLALIHPSGREELREHLMTDVLARHGRFDKEYRIIQPRTQAERWVHGVGELEFDSQNRPVRLAGTIQDVTERKELQARAAQSERLSSMGMLAAGVAHEINNPLAHVMYNVETLAADLAKISAAATKCAGALRDQIGDAAFAGLLGDQGKALLPASLADVADRAKEAVEGTQRIKALTRSLNTFARVEPSEERRVDLKRAIESALTMAGNELRYRARVVTKLEEVPAIWASEGKVSQVFLNLFINAAHAIEEGHTEQNTVTVSTWAEGDDVFAQVEDTGRGILPEHLDRIFDPFFSTKEIGKGTGLGLAVCKNIVSEFRGEIQVESEAGKGSRFLIRLPASQETTEHQVLDLEAPAQAGAHEPVIPGRVLVVDDELTIRKTITRLLSESHEVVSAASGAAAREILEKDQRFDLILSDLMMPNMSGMDLHAWLCGFNPKLAERVVFITGGVFTPRASQYLASVKNLQLDKPFAAADLSNLVAAGVRKARSG